MRSSPTSPVVLALAVVSALTAAAPAPASAQVPSVPSGLAEIERARTQRCVGAIARAADVQEELTPLFERADRIQLLNAAVALEDSTRAAPFAADDPVELAVREWFAADHALALQWAETGDETIQERRAEAKEQLRARLQEALDPLRQQTEARLETDGAAVQAAAACEDMFLVRSAALEVCDSVAGPACEDAAVPEPRGRFPFVEAAEDLWDIEQIRPWSQATPVYPTPDGGLAGARTVAVSRRGNLILAVGLEPMLRDRASLSEEELADAQVTLDSLGFTFDHPRLTMAPVLTVQLNAQGPLGGETDYVLHFGDLSDPLNDIIWTAPVPTERAAISAVVPVAGWILNALAAGEPVTLTALRRDASGSAEVAYALAVAAVGQSQAVAPLLAYMGNGRLAADLTEILPPQP